MLLLVNVHLILVIQVCITIHQFVLKQFILKVRFLFMGDKTWEQACFLGLLMMVHEVVTEDMQFFFPFSFYIVLKEHFISYFSIIRTLCL